MNSFKDVYDKYGPIIREKVDFAATAVMNPSNCVKAVKSLNEATALADEHGIPYYSKVVAAGTSIIMEVEHSHVPTSFFKLFVGEAWGEVSQLTGVSVFSLKKNDPNFEPDEEEEDWDEDEIEEEEEDDNDW